MENRFVIKRGYISQGDSSITGSLVVTGGITGSFSGSYVGDGSGLTGVGAFPFTGSALITGSLAVTGSFLVNNNTSNLLIVSSSGLSTFTSPSQFSGNITASPLITLRQSLLSFGNSSVMLRLVETSVNNSFSVALYKRSGTNETHLLTGGAGSGTNTERTFIAVTGTNTDGAGSLYINKSNTNIGYGVTGGTGARLDVKAQGALSTDIAFRVRNSADTINRLSLTGTAFSITTVDRAEMSVTANAINFGLDNHNVVFTHSSAGQVLQTQRSVGAAFGHLATLGLSNVETLTNGSTIFGSTIRGGVLTNVQNKMHFVCDKTKWGLDGVYSAGFQWFKGNQAGDAGFNTATLPSITTANRQMWLTPENSLLFFNTSGITFTTNTDSFQQYSADITAGNAAPHFRTENGSIIKLYQQSAVTSSQGLADVLTNVGLLSGSSVIAPTFPYTGSAEITGSLTVTGSVAGAVQTLAIISSTASLDLSQGNFFELTLSSSTTTYLEPINIQPGQTINLKINQPATSGSLTYDSTLKFPGGIPYSASATGSVTDIVSLISFDSTTLYATAIKNLS